MCEDGGISLVYLAALPGHLPHWISSSAAYKPTLKLLVPFNTCLLSLNSPFTPATIRRHPTIEQAYEIGEAGISKKLNIAVVIISIVVTASIALLLARPGCSAGVHICKPTVCHIPALHPSKTRLPFSAIRALSPIDQS
jgi:hypothetical protein